MELGYFGMVRQNTGEDWNDVALTLSTARPALGGSPPSLAAWNVDVSQPLALQAKQAMIGDEMEARAAPAGAEFKYAANTLSGTRINSVLSDLGGPIQVASAGIDRRVTSTSFRIAAAASVPSDRTARKVSIASLRLEDQPEYLAIPKQVEAAFLTSKVTNTSELPLLAGAMNVFLDDTFVAASRLKTVMPGERFDLELGADDAIALARRLDRHVTENTGFTGRGRRLTCAYTLTVENHRPGAAKVVVLDQIPVSRNEKIAVSLLAPEKDQASIETDGTVKWTLTLQPGEKRELPLRFAVEYPSDLPVTGLD